MIEDIIKMIEDLSVALPDEKLKVSDGNLFNGELPLESQDGVAVMYSVSPEPNKTFDVYEQHIDFWSRYTDSRAAYSHLKFIQSLFHRKYAYESENNFVYFSSSLGAIEDMDRDSERKKMFKLSMRFIYRPLVLS